MTSPQDLARIWALVIMLLVNLGLDPQMLSSPERMLQFLMSGPLTGLFQSQMPTYGLSSNQTYSVDTSQMAAPKLPQRPQVLDLSAQSVKVPIQVPSVSVLPSLPSAGYAGPPAGLSEADALTSWQGGSFRAGGSRTAGSASVTGATVRRTVEGKRTPPIVPIALGLGLAAGGLWARRRLFRPHPEETPLAPDE